jgi:hypothetical protein
MNRRFGRLLVILFGLSMFLEVACLPLFTSFAFQFEKSIFAELADKEDEEKTESLGDFKVAFDNTDEHFPDPILLSSKSSKDIVLDPNPGIMDHVFIKNHSLRL